ncbi:MAG: hypothetical protein FWG70_04510 [Oscillospiraceae bacterium]|nr:hypothetical protein [Oscillospiraceae bacterium]
MEAVERQYNLDINIRYAEGRAAGKAEGKREGTIKVARNALQRKMPIADIADITGLPLKEIERLQQQ